MPRTTRGVTRGELAALVIGACLLSVVMNWPLVLHLGQDIPRDLGDPLAEAWQIAWGGYALGHQPLHFFESNQFWPLHETLAFSDALVGYAPAGLFGSGPHAAVFRYDLLFLFTYALAFVGAYLLGRELGLGPAGAAVAGAAFAFAPFRLEQDGHMQVISSGGIPLAFALGVRGYRLRRPGWVFAAFIVAAWQLSIGFTLGLPLAYLLTAIGAIGAIVWLRRGRPPLDRRLAVATVAGALILASAGFALSRPYVRVVDAHPDARREPAEVEAYSGPPWVFLVAPEENLVWGGATAPIRDTFSTGISEKTLFPGLVIVALAIAGLASPAYPRWVRRGLGLGVIAVLVLALGFREGGGILWPYRMLYEVLPGWQGIRVPGRLVTFSSLGLALLAGAGAQRWAAAIARRRAPAAVAAPGRAQRRGAPATAGLRIGAWRGGVAGARRLAPWRGRGAVAALLVLAIVVEGRGLPFDPFDDQVQPQVPPVPRSTASVPAPQLHLPAWRASDNRRYILWSTDGFPDLVNGRSSFNPPFTQHLIDSVLDFPDRPSAALLAREGVRSVVLHTNRVQGTPWQGAAHKPIARLPVARRRLGELVVYEIRSKPGADTTSRSDAGSDRRSR
jgi:hypothetical protein